MAADAEVKLNFTASIEQARAAIAEVSAAMEKLQATGGVMRPEDAALMNEMQGQLAAYKARVDELDAAYRALQASGGEANTAALEQIKELQQEVETLTKQQNALVDKVVSLQVENNKLKGGVQEVGKETEKAGDGGVKVVRSMRGLITGLARDLVRGQVNVKEFGLALSGLAKSTGILLAIDLVVRGIAYAFGLLKDAIFGTEEEAERLKEKMDKAAQASKDAADKMQAAFKKAHDEQAAAKAKKDAGALSFEYERQADALKVAADEVQRQARAEANMRALKASEEDHALAMKRLELDTQLAEGKISQREYRDAVLALDEEKARVQAQRVRDKADADFKASQNALALANQELENARTAWAAAQDKLDGMVTPERIQQQKNLIASLQAALDKANLDIEQNGITDANVGAKYEITQQLNAAMEKLGAFTNTAEEYNAVKAEVADLRRQFDAAVKAQRAAGVRDSAAYQERGFRYSQAGQQERQAGEVRQARQRLNAANDNAERGKLQGEVNELVNEVRRAVNTKKNQKDDADAYKEVGNFLKRQSEDIEQYGVNVRELLKVCRQLNLGTENSKGRIGALDKQIKDLQRKVNRTNSQQ